MANEFNKKVRDTLHGVGLAATHDQTKQVVDALWPLIVNEVEANGRLVIRKFGTFEIQTRKVREGRNPQSGEKIKIPERRAFTFKSKVEL
jgi:DNA-binding protein HU-beta